MKISFLRTESRTKFLVDITYVTYDSRGDTFRFLHYYSREREINCHRRAKFLLLYTFSQTLDSYIYGIGEGGEGSFFKLSYIVRLRLSYSIFAI